MLPISLCRQPGRAGTAPLAAASPLPPRQPGRRACWALLLPLLFGLLGACSQSTKTEGTTNTTATKAAADTTGLAKKAKWWKEAVVYQIYPRSYQDSNGDGVGDIRGIISRLDYVKTLGVNVIWLNPSYASPNADNGYDISDYRQIQPEYGTMADFDAMLTGLHQRGIKLVMDLVVNHSSDEHAWFKQARTSRTNPYYNYYHWWPAEKGKPPHRYSNFDINDEAWAYNKATNSYYLHYFAVKQPDLNWENPKLRQEIYSMMRFWFDKGIDGFRMDVIPFISKDTTFPPIPAKYNGDYFAYYANGPHLHEYLQEMNREVLSKYPQAMTVAEGAGVTSDQVLDFVDPARHELNMLYHFEGLGIKHTADGPPPSYSLVEFKQVYTKWENIFADKGWGSIYLGNHDRPRMLSRWGDDRPQFRVASSKLLSTFLLTMHDTPYTYYGDEIGMINSKFDNIANYRDIETLNRYQQVKNKNGDMAAFMEEQKRTARDNARTPMQWDAAANAGFTTGTPWIKINPNYPQVNVAVEDKDPASILNYFRRAVAVRHAHKVLVYGQYQLLDEDNPHIYAYTRTLGTEKALVVLNFSPEAHEWELPAGLQASGQPWLNNYAAAFAADPTLKLQPWQAVVLPIR